MLPSSSPRYNTDTITTQLLHYYPRPFNCLPRQISSIDRSPSNILLVPNRMVLETSLPLPKMILRSFVALRVNERRKFHLSLSFFFIYIFHHHLFHFFSFASTFSFFLEDTRGMKKMAQGSLEVITSGNKRGVVCIKSAGPTVHKT